MAFARSMAMAAKRLGCDPTAALLAARISDQQLSEVNGRITASQMERLSDQLMRELDDEALGWFSRRLPWGSYGMLARASITSPTLHVAMQRWCRHHALLTKDVELLLQVNSGEPSPCATISVIENVVGPWLDDELREFCHISLLRNLLGLSSWLVDSRIPLQRMDFAFDAPPHVKTYQVLFGAPCHFNQPCTRLSFDHRYLELPLNRDETSLRQMLQRALPLTVHTYRKDRLIVSRVRQTLLSNPETLRNAHLLATALHTSVRTLHRLLKEEGTGLQTLKNDVRRERAIFLIHRTTQPIKKIALAVGFDNDKSFLRAFRTWTGLTPDQARKVALTNCSQ